MDSSQACTCPEILLRWSASHWDKRVKENLHLKEMTYLQVQWCVSEIHQIETIRVNANESTLMNNLSTKHPSTYITFSETKQTNKTASEERPVVQCKQSIHAWPLDVQDCSLIFSFPYHFILRLKSRWSAVCKLFYIITGC